MRLVVALLLVGCSTPSGTAADAGDPFAEPVKCTSGTFRDPNESEAPEMMPGHACIRCHAEVNAATGEGAPVFLFAGTVYPSGHEPDNCKGPFGATIVLYDSEGRTINARSNSSGNFFYEADPRAIWKPPFRAKIIYNRRERWMMTPQANGDCNTCHTQNGAEGAPGRIVLP